MAGEAEEMAAVMYIFVHIHAGNDRSGPFLNAHEIDQHEQQHGEDQPGKDLANRNDNRGRGCVRTDFAMAISLGSSVPLECNASRREV